jgi:carbamoyl-phosphate synthase large subunit
VHPVYKRIDTCAGEFPSLTPYMYSAYERPSVDGPDCEAAPSERSKVMILGGGPNRIGQGIEFDYCCVHAVYALEETGIEAIMVNCNPETVSTDYDTADRLYFEPLTAEDVIEIARVEQSAGRLLGVMVQFGGQTPLKLAHDLEAARIPILGTSPDAIDLAEDRRRFQELLTSLGLRQPDNGTATSTEEAVRVADEIGYPVILRPSYVLGGRAMEIVHDREQLLRYVATAVQVSGKTPVLIDRYLRDAVEVDVDAVSDGDDVYIAGVMEHIEEAGIHSGDSACVLPPHNLAPAVVEEIERQTRMLAEALSVVRQGVEEMAEVAQKRHGELAEKLAAQVSVAEARIAEAKETALANIRQVASEVARAATLRVIGVEIEQDQADAAVAAARGGRG